MQSQSLGMQHRLICSTRGVQTPAEVHAYSRCDVSVSLASRSPVPALGFRKIRDPTWRKSISNRPNKLNHELRCSTSVHTQQGNCTTACNGNIVLHTCPTKQPCQFRQAASELCVLAALPAHSTLVCSSLLLLQLLATYALVRRKASSGMQRTCSDRASQSLGPI